MHYLCDHELLGHTRIPPHNDRSDAINHICLRFHQDLENDPTADSPALPNPYYEDRFVTVREMLSILLDNGARVSQQNENGQAPLYLAACSPWHGFLALLLRKRPNDPAVNIAYSAENKIITPLFAAFKAGNVSSVQLLLRNGADIHCRDHNGYNALHLAMSSPNPEVQIVHALIDAGCPIDESHPSIGSELHIAAICGFVLAIRVLIEAGCSWDKRNSEGLTSLGVALQAATFERNGAAEELIGVLNGQIVRDEDRGSGDLVCMVLQSADPGNQHGEVIAKLLISNGAGIHKDYDD
ncbi:ankyrin repeat-containing domain protein [Aspergillus multicolor]|uniref:ankyrin repeat domain-containing protein n=1 Tax=Aspergillus multicolor TaxID=41759 RepID=UPI003CCD4F3A